MKKVVIFGTRDLAQLARFYFETDSDYTPVAFTADSAYVEGPSFEGLPLVAFEEVEKLYPPEDHFVSVPLTQAKMGRIRREKYEAAKAKGYSFADDISSKATYFNSS